MKKKALKVAVIGGAGHVGLPFSLVLAQKGIEIISVDIDENKIQSLKQGKFPFLEKGGPELLKHSKDWPINFTNDFNKITTCDAIVITIGTPVDEHLTPDLAPVFGTIDQLEPFLRNGQCLILRSTVFPGTSERIQTILDDAGLDVSVSFCPERIAQGKAIEELPALPQIISGGDKRAYDIAKRLFRVLEIDIIELSLIEAEVAKLFANSLRYIQFATSNQFYAIAAEKNLDFERIRNAIMHKYERAVNMPRSGFAAGPCLFKDTMQLAAYSRQTFSLGQAAMLINETMPDLLVAKIKEEENIQTFKNQKVGILGMAFKPNNDDSRESLAFKLKKILTYEGAKVMCTDVYIKNSSFYLVENLIEECNIIFLGCPHDEYIDIKFKTNQKIVDCWGFYQKSFPKIHIHST